MDLTQMEIQDLPDYPLLTMLSYLDASSLYELSKTSLRFENLALTNRFWRYIDARRTPNKPGKVAYCCDRTFELTRHVRFRGDDPFEVLLFPDYYNKLCSYNYISVLVLENQTIDGYEIKLANFPSTLKELSLRRSVVANCTEFFRFSFDVMINLRVLILNECDWVETSCFMSLGKYQNLEILSVYKCRRLENTIAYLSIAGTHGFQKLRVFDARLSSLGHTVLRYLHKHTSLLAIYLQNEDISYKLDYLQRKLDLARGAKPVDFYIEDDEFSFDDSLTNEENGVNHEVNIVTDNGLVDYLYSQGTLESHEMPHSEIYEDPYEKCTCKCDLDISSASNSTDNDNDDNNAPGGGEDNALNKMQNTISKLTHIVLRTQFNISQSRGIFNQNHRRSPHTTNSVVNIRNTDGELYRGYQGANQDVHIVSSTTLQGQKRSRQSDLARPGRPLSQQTMTSVISARFKSAANQNRAGSSTSNGRPFDDPICSVNVSQKVKQLKPVSYKHRDKRNHNMEAQKDKQLEQRIIDVEIHLPEDQLPSTSGYQLFDRFADFRADLLRRQQQDVLNRTKNDNSDSDDDDDDDTAGAAMVTPRRDDKMIKLRLFDYKISRQSSPRYEQLESDKSEEEEMHISKKPKLAVRPPTPYPVIEELEKSGVTIRRILFDDYPVKVVPNEDKDKTAIPLKRLSLRGYKHITDVTLHYIQGLHLELLDLTYTNVTETGIKDYLTYHPDCRIVHEKFCTCKPKLHF